MEPEKRGEPDRHRRKSANGDRTREVASRGRGLLDRVTEGREHGRALNRALLRSAVIATVGLWVVNGAAQAPAPVPAAPGAGAVPAGAPALASAAPAPAPAPAPTPAPAPASAAAPPTSSATAPFPVWNGTTASLLPASFGSPLPLDARSYAPRTWGIVAGVVGLLAVAEGFLLAAIAKSSYGDSNAPGYCVNDVCTQQGLDKRSGARTAADVATGAFVAGGLLIGGGVTLYVLAAQAPNDPVAVGVAPGGVSVRGAW